MVNKQKHLTRKDRRFIEEGIANGANKVSIAAVLGKDPSTIGKEIKKHRRKTYTCKMALECTNYKTCSFGRRCHAQCPSYIPFTCQRRDRSPGACNGCPDYRYCRFHKFRYDADEAQGRYEHLLKQSREGLDLDEDTIQRLAQIVVPAIKNGLSPEQIVLTYPDLGLCLKTLYNYIELGVFKPWNVTVLSLRQKLRRKIPKNKQALYKKRKDYRYLAGRTYKDYLAFKQEHPEAYAVQMDTLYNRPEGPFLQTFKFLEWDFFLAFLQDRRTAEKMVTGLDLLEEILTPDLFRQTLPVLLTDRGSEFTAAKDLEKQERTRIFYCDPMSPGQKGSLEKRHAELRYILPKHRSFIQLGLTSQKKVNRICSHLNSVPRAKTFGKTPFQLANFYCPLFTEKLEQFGIHEIQKGKVNLTPKLLK